MILAFALAALSIAPPQEPPKSEPEKASQAPAPPPGPTPEEIEAARLARLREGGEAVLRAYRKEYAFLAAEEEALKARLEDVARERRERVDLAELEVAAFKERLADLQSRLAGRREELRRAEEKNASIQEDGDALEATLSQAFASLERYGVRPPEPKAGASAVETRERSVDHAFGRAAAILADLGTVKGSEEAFFLADGRQTRGRILRVGGIAALSVGEPRGPLAPAGGGSLKAWPVDSPRAGAVGEDISTAPVLPLFVYESLDKAVEEDKKPTAAEHVAAGGAIAWVIVGLGAVLAALLLLRTAVIALCASDARGLMDRITRHALEGRWDEALAEARRASGAAARLARAALERRHEGPERLETILSERLLQENLRLDRFDTAVSVSNAVAPLLGLLGTVTGMISMFDVITVYGTGDPKLLSAGISEALITTELGLMACIPGLLWGNLLVGWGERTKTGLENAALRLIHLLSPPEEPPRNPTTEIRPLVVEDGMSPAGAGRTS